MDNKRKVVLSKIFIYLFFFCLGLFIVLCINNMSNRIISIPQTKDKIKSTFSVSYILDKNSTFEDYVTMIKFLEETYPGCKIVIKNNRDIYLNVYSEGGR